MKITEWFDPWDLNHIKAYDHLMSKGVWPEGFIPEGMEFPNLWYPHLTGMMAGMWVQFMMNRFNNKEVD